MQLVCVFFVCWFVGFVSLRDRVVCVPPSAIIYVIIYFSLLSLSDFLPSIFRSVRGHPPLPLLTARDNPRDDPRDNPRVRPHLTGFGEDLRVMARGMWTRSAVDFFLRWNLRNLRWDGILKSAGTGVPAPALLGIL